MLHTAQLSSTRIAPTGAFNGFHDGAIESAATFAAPIEGYAVSSANDVALHESAEPMTVAMVSTPASLQRAANDGSVATAGDTTMMMLGLISAWLVLVGAAMLSRYFRLAKIEATQI